MCPVQEGTHGVIPYKVRHCVERGTKTLFVDFSQLQLSMARYHCAFILAKALLCLGKALFASMKKSNFLVNRSTGTIEVANSCLSTI